jgi:hypothetical protein
MVAQAGLAFEDAALQKVVALVFGRSAGGSLEWEVEPHLPEPHFEMLTESST